jgi:hypothetical protein
LNKELLNTGLSPAQQWDISGRESQIQAFQALADILKEKKRQSISLKEIEIIIQLRIDELKRTKEIYEFYLVKN